MHLSSPDNHDIFPQPATKWTDAWHNDYWGRPLSSGSSHKSWRPIAVWTFRFGKGGRFGGRWIALAGRAIGGFAEGLLGLWGGGLRSGDDDMDAGASGEPPEGAASELFVHRFVNVLIHAALVQMVGAVATLLFSHDPSSERTPSKLQLCTKYIAQLLFALHPVHVEAVANIANRPHILALLLNTTIIDPHAPLAALAVLFALGLLTAETAIFQLPAIVLTMTAIHYRELSLAKKNGGGGNRSTQKSLLTESVVTLLPRFVLLGLLSAAYLVYRHCTDTLAISPGLIRPAENPFYVNIDRGVWNLERRMMNYSYVLSVHIMKSLGVEVLGFRYVGASWRVLARDAPRILQ